MDMQSQLERSASEGSASPANGITRPKGRNLRWCIVAIITLLTLTNYLDRGNLSVAAPLIMKDFNISATMMGVILSAFVWPYAIMSLPTGWAIDRFGARILMAIAAGLWTLVAIATGFAREVHTFIYLRIGLGVSESPLFPAAIKATNSWFPDHEKALASSIYLSASQFGLAVAPPVATVLMVTYGWPMMFIIMGAFGFVALVGWLILYREPDQHKWLHPDELAYIKAGQAARLKAEQSASVEDNAGWFALFKYPTTWIMMIGGFSLQYVLWFYISWLPTYLQKAQGFAINRAGFVAAIPYIAGGIAVVIGGKFSDSLVRRGSSPFKSRRILLAASAILTGLAMFATAFCTSPTMAVFMLTVGMFTYSLSSANYWTLPAEAVTTKRMVASLAGIQNFGGFLGGGCAPILTGLAVDYMGGFVAALILAGCLAMFSALMYGFVLRKKIPV